MSLLSNLLNKLVNEAEKAVKEAEKEVINAQINDGEPFETPAAPAQPAYSEPGGFYDDIPEEENQYNSGLSFIEYFRKVFSEEFPGYAITEEYVDPGRRYTYTFNKDGGIALVVEVMTEKSSVQKLRRSCESAGVPYLRFYFDHYGWWNTRSYVVERVRRVLG